MQWLIDRGYSVIEAQFLVILEIRASPVHVDPMLVTADHPGRMLVCTRHVGHLRLLRRPCDLTKKQRLRVCDIYMYNVKPPTPL